MSNSLPTLEVDSIITSGLLQLVKNNTGLVLDKDTSKLDIRKMICNFERCMEEAVESGNLVDTAHDYVLKHHFADGIYAREMHIPKGHVIVGKIHRHEN
jgi:ABC-type hemin transport system ATPase subunit